MVASVAAEEGAMPRVLVVDADDPGDLGGSALRDRTRERACRARRLNLNSTG
jgi:hypothetical protein